MCQLSLTMNYNLNQNTMRSKIKIKDCTFEREPSISELIFAALLVIGMFATVIIYGINKYL